MHGTTHARPALVRILLQSRSQSANFLRRLLDKNEGSGKDQFPGDPDWLSEMQYNKSAISDY